MSQNLCRLCRLGRIDYGPAWRLQKRLAQAVADKTAPDTLLLLEHPPTYTLGRKAKEEHFLASRQMLAAQGVAIFRVDRGGDITYHGPGQLVGYPILSLKDRPGGASKYLRDIEEVLIRALAGFGVEAGRLPGFTGVWAGDEKVGAIGVKINSRRVTEHGFALNISTDLRYFGQIIPCGIRGRGVTTLSNLLGRPVFFEEVIEAVALAFGEVFKKQMVETNPGDVIALLEEGFEKNAAGAGGELISSRP